MGLEDALGSVADGAGTPQPRDRGEEITRDDILREFRRACWDTWISNLPDPVIADVRDPGPTAGAAQRRKASRGFDFNVHTGTTYFNLDHIPRALRTRREKSLFARSIFHHEVGGHYGLAPGDATMEALIIDAALKGLTVHAVPAKDDPDYRVKAATASRFAHLIMNIETDLILDTYMATERYGREDLGELTRWRERELVRNAKEKVKRPSALWQVLVRTYEKLWSEDLGLADVVPVRDVRCEGTADELVRILGRDWKDRTTWPRKATAFARTLEPCISQSMEDAEQGIGMEDGTPAEPGTLPDDLKGQMGDAPDQSRTRDPDAPPGAPALEGIYQQNRNNPAGFAGTMAALHGTSPAEATRLLYRARATEYRMQIPDRDRRHDESKPANYTPWLPGDPPTGRGGLETIPSLTSLGRIIPFISASKRELERSTHHGQLGMIPNLLLIIDSSCSMGWDPDAPDPERRGEFDKAILAGESAAQEARSRGGKVAVANFSSGDHRIQDYTTDLARIEEALMHSYKGGTVVPKDAILDLIRRSHDPLQVCFISDCDMTNVDDAIEALLPACRPPDQVAVFQVSPRALPFVDRIRQAGATVYPIARLEDLTGIVLGTVRQRYRRGQA